MLPTGPCGPIFKQDHRLCQPLYAFHACWTIRSLPATTAVGHIAAGDRGPLAPALVEASGQIRPCTPLYQNPVWLPCQRTALSRAAFPRRPRSPAAATAASTRSRPSQSRPLAAARPPCVAARGRALVRRLNRLDIEVLDVPVFLFPTLPPGEGGGNMRDGECSVADTADRLWACAQANSISIRRRSATSFDKSGSNSTPIWWIGTPRPRYLSA